MKFSEFVMTERAGVLVDPLGFMKPSRALQDTVFRQFTVLTNHPAYHGFLCLAWKLLDDAGHKVGSPGFSFRFRQAEILWGLLNASQGTPILNITKFNDLLDAGVWGLGHIQRNHPIYNKLAYGTLGHYSQPSIAWGLLEPGGRALSASGLSLAKAASWRGKLDFAAWLKRWNDGDEFTQDEIDKLKAVFHIQARPSEQEQTQWKALIGRWTQLNPKTASLWKDPVDIADLDAADQSPENYREFHRKLREHYYPSLQLEMLALDRFERLSGAVQFIFNAKLASLEFTGDLRIEPWSGREDMAMAVVELAKANVQAQGHQPGQLFTQLAHTVPNYQMLEDVIVLHHIRHQRAKGVSPFLEDSRLLVRQKVDPKVMGKRMEELETDADAQASIDRLQFHSGRDWHFRRCHTWHDWAYGAGQ